MNLHLASVLALGVLIGCASQSSLMNIKHMSEETLITHYHEIEADIIATQKLLEDSSKSGRVIPSAIRQDELNDLRKRKYTVQSEFTRRGLPLPATNAPGGDGRH